MAIGGIYPDRNSRETRKIPVTSTPTAADAKGLYPGDRFINESTGTEWTVTSTFGVVAIATLPAVQPIIQVNRVISDLAWTSSTPAAIGGAAGGSTLKTQTVCPAPGNILVEISANYLRHNGAAGEMDVSFFVYLDSVAQTGADFGLYMVTFGQRYSGSAAFMIPVAAGTHNIEIYQAVYVNAAKDVRVDVTQAAPRSNITLVTTYIQT